MKTKLQDLMRLCWMVGFSLLALSSLFAQVQIGGTLDGQASNEYFGSSVSISANGQRIAIGASYAVNYAGTVRIYDYDGSAWVQVGSDIDGEATWDYSGRSISLSSDGTRVAIGAPYNSDNGTNSGHVRIYEYNGSSWVQLGSDIDGEAASDQSGSSVSLSSDGTRVAVGAPYNGNYSGHVRIYEYNGNGWMQLGSDIDGEAAWDESGRAVSLSSDGTRVAIGAPYNGGNGNMSGHARIYEYNGSSWVQLGSDIDGEAARDQSGRSVSLSSDGTRVAIGAEYNDGNGSDAGHVRIYEYNGSSWVQLGSDINGEAADDYSGRSVSLSSDGTRIAIGAGGNDGNGKNSGHVRIYDYNGSAWVQVGNDIDGVADSYFGVPVAISSDGSRIIAGAPFYGANWSYIGQAKAFELPSNFLPVTYLHFYGSATASGHRLDWATGMEENNQGFYIERSTDGRRFEAIGWVDGAGTTQVRQDYTYLDPTPPAGVAYYRLQQVDYDGTTAYSSVVTVVKRSKEDEVICYPNPVTDQLTIENAPASIATIYNMLGQPLWQQAITSSPFQLSTAALPSGLYTLTIQHSDGRQYTQSLVK